MTMRSHIRLTSQHWGILFIAPAVAFFLVVNILPMLYAAFLSLHDWNLLSIQKSFVFLDNYVDLLQSSAFRRCLLNTFLYTIIIVPLSLALGLGIALLLNAGLRAESLFRTLYFIPVVTSVVAAGYIWTWLYDPTFGFINQSLAPLGVQLPFLKSTWMALPSIALMSVWKTLGFNVVIFLAGLQGIPRYVYEAARVDGASRWRIFSRITLPLLNPTVLFLSVIGVMHSFKIFGEVYVMSEDGGPLGSTKSVVFEVVQTSFESHRMGYGAAMTMILFVAIIAVTLIQMKLVTKEYKY